MLIDDLPRLTDADREALDGGYVALAGVPAFDIDDLIAERIAALKAMRVAAGDLQAFAVASRREAELAAQIRRLRQASNAACPDCRGSGLDPAEGSLCERCEGSGNRPATVKPVKAVAVVVVLALLTGCASVPMSAYIEAGLGYMQDTPTDAGARDISRVENPRGVLAAGIVTPIRDRVELSAEIRHDSGALVYDYGQTGVYAAVRWYLIKR